MDHEPSLGHLDLPVCAEMRKAAIEKAVAKLLPAIDRDALEATWGRIIGPWLDAKLEAKAVEVVARSQESWRKALDCDIGLPRDQLLCSREDAAKMLGVSLSTIQRMEGGELPEALTIGERNRMHRLIDIEGLARIRGQRVLPLE